MADIHFFRRSSPVESSIFSHDVRQKLLVKSAVEKEIPQMFHNSGSEEKYDLSQNVYIPRNKREPASSDGCFSEIAQNNFSSESENEEDLSINIDSKHANT
ncbi:hypothetical protein AVEN_243691-1 [Araneus ventricosus]|uniref:Uncharacterized protein n=1 Tax=Araneus ventricosus TaxID=182803 RepID=A0A4Y2A4V7_ARAVE|nr:hypothetical protein AVEN_243691-1 [Araneus ventricosus]